MIQPNQMSGADTSNLHTCTHMHNVHSLTGVDNLLAVACEGASPLPKTFLMTINGP